MIQSVTKDNFDNEILKAQIPVVVDFYADWCGPCKMMSPLMEKLSSEYEGKVKFCKVNVDEEAQLASMFGIEVIPTLIVIKGGKTVNKSVGYIDKQQVLELINV